MTRLSVNINAESAEILSSVARERGTSVTEEVRRAIGLLDLVEQVRAANETLIVEHQGQRYRVRTL